MYKFLRSNNFHSQMFKLILVLLHAHFCFSNLCNVIELEMNVTDIDSAYELISTVSCEGGVFYVTWDGSVKILEAIVVGENTQLHVLGANNATIDGSGLVQLFKVAVNSRLKLKQLKLTGGVDEYGGAIFLNTGASLLVDDCEFVSNSAFAAGGAIYMFYDVMADIYHSLFFSNKVYYNDDGDAEIFGGAVHIGKNSTVNIVGCNFTQNSAGDVDIGDSSSLSHISKISSSSSSRTYHFTTSFWSNNSYSVGDGSYSLSSSVTSSSTSSSITSTSSSSSTEGTSSTSSYSTPDYYAGSGGAISFQSTDSILYISESYFDSNSATTNGGSIFAYGSTLSFFIEETDFVNNSASDDGGAVFIDSATDRGRICIDGIDNTTIFASNFIGNSASNGGAISFSSQSGLTVISTMFRDNYVSAWGGGIDSSTGELKMFNCTGFNNTAYLGGFVSYHGSTLHLTDVQAFYNNAKFGGVLNASFNVMYVTNCTFNFNSISNDGGAISLVASTGDKYVFANIKASNFNGNWANLTGGAIYASGEIMISITDTTISNCSATESGGAIQALDLTKLTATNSTFSNNTANFGGAIQSIGEVKINNCKASYNKAITFGGFIYVGYGGKAKLYNSTFSGNTAFNGGVLFAQEQSEVYVKLAQFIGNTASQAGAGIFQYSDDLDVEVRDVSFTNSTSYCCYAEGTVLDALSLYSCADIDIGSGTLQCCPYFQFSRNGFCETCGNMFQCNKVGLLVTAVPLSKGYWREYLDSSSGLKCKNEGACKGGNAEKSSDEYCAEGYHGPYCAVCRPGYVHSIGHSCSKCSSDSRAITLTVVVLIMVVICSLILLVLASLLQIENATDAATVINDRLFNNRIRSILSSIPFGKLRDPYVVLTMLTQYITITGLKLSPLYSNFIGWINIINFDISWFASASCAVNIGFYDKLLLSTLIPLGIISLTGCTYLFNLRQMYNFKMSSRSLSEARKQTRSKHVLVILIFCFLIYSTVSTVIFQTFACDKLPDSKNTWLRADYSVSCDNNEHTIYLYYAGFMILVYPIGIPVLFLCLLWKVKEKIRNVRETSLINIGSDYNLKSTSFLWSKYRRSKWWWEIMECLRRLMLTGFLVFILPGTAGQAAVSSLFAVVNMVVFGMAHPMIDYDETQTYWLGCFILFGTCLSTLLLNGEYAAEEDNSQTIISICLVVLNILLIVTALWQLITGYRLARKNVIIQQNSFFGLRTMNHLEDDGDTALHRDRTSVTPKNLPRSN